MAVQTLAQEIQKLISGNTIYNQNRADWTFLIESFQGGRLYQDAGHLVRYQEESDPEYNARLRATPLNNHCASIISTYTSFLFREECERNLGSLANREEIEDFMEDANFEGRSLTAFMSDVATWNSVFGHSWILVTKPNLGASTLAEEIELGVRPYVNLITPLAVLDWNFQRSPNGRYTLSYFKYQEDINGNVQTIVEWTPEQIITTIVDTENEIIEKIETVPNQLGIIPAVISYNRISGVRGLGVSDINDIAPLQRYIYNCTSEIEQSIRLNTHPSLVKTPDTAAGIGAGSVIHMPENLDPGLKPYYLEYTGSSVDSILRVIEQTESAIDKIANTGGIRATESRTISGVALETEFQLLNAKLSEKAHHLELTEENIWRLVAMYSGLEWDGSVSYPGSFNIRDTNAEITQLKQAKDAATDPQVIAAIDRAILHWLDEDTNEYGSDEAHPTTEPGPERTAHIQEMIMDGLTDEQILALHPELNQSDIDAAKRELLDI